MAVLLHVSRCSACKCSILRASPLPDEVCLAGVMGLLAELYGSGSACWSNKGEGRAPSEPRQTGLRATHKAVSIFMRTSVGKLLQASLCMLYAVLAPQQVEGQSGSSQSSQGSGCQCTSTLALPPTHYPHTTHMRTHTTHTHTCTQIRTHTHTHTH